MDQTGNELLKSLQQVDEYEFEKLVADLWHELGWDTTVTSGSRDRGIDIVATKQTPFFQKQLIQTKRYSSSNKVGSPEIQQYSSLQRQIIDVDTVAVVTTGNFTSQAQDIASSLNVKLVDGNSLISLINELNAYPVIRDYIDDREAFYAREEGIKKCIELSKKNREAFRCNIHHKSVSNTYPVGYYIIPKVNIKGYPFKNIHVFTESRFDTKKIKSIGNKFKLFEIETVDTDSRIFMGQVGSGWPQIKQIEVTMDQFLFELIEFDIAAYIKIEEINAEI